MKLLTQSLTVTVVPASDSRERSAQFHTVSSNTSQLAAQLENK